LLPRNADQLPDCYFLLLGLIRHTADAAGADTTERIASITAVVEICLIGLSASRAWKWCSGSGDSPNKMAAGLFRGGQGNGLVGPNRKSCGLPVALARSMGAGSTGG